MKSFLKENYFLLFALLPLLITFICLQVNIPVWDKSTQKTLFYSVFLYDYEILSR